MADKSQLPQFLKAKEVADWLGISEQALANDRFRGDGIPFVRIGSRIRYRLADLLQYVEQNTVVPGEQVAVAPVNRSARVHTARRV